MSKDKVSNNFIQSNGIMSEGYGFSPKAVMRDPRLTIEAKAIYAYMSSFAGAGLSSFPSIELQLAELGISKTRYYKHRKLLEQFGYITIKQTRIKNENNKSINDKNIYTLEQFPIEKTVISESTQNEETQKSIENTSISESTQNEDSQNEYTQNEVAQNEDSNSNNLNSNNLNSNNLNSNNLNKSSSKDDEDIKKIMKICQMQNYKLTKKDVTALLLVYDFTKVAKAIVTASAIGEEIKNYKGYLLAVLNDMEKIKNTTVNINKKDKDIKFNDFPQREYDYNALERKLLGYDN
ncbi:helix-turn-helix domain-containing protein [Clostridium sardiniense]|uniref:helix-turn-helix domain-containing protein n=1 Tax=Clostridium sardiniense TaxID=29369 RepID=UPI00195C1FAA|nr:helix-turn-helix domain-containing protein [Clostridium sardiniense]MBM7836455.1 hypothetical protein [Clostridium sardiniense]